VSNQAFATCGRPQCRACGSQCFIFHLAPFPEMKKYNILISVLAFVYFLILGGMVKGRKMSLEARGLMVRTHTRTHTHTHSLTHTHTHTHTLWLTHTHTHTHTHLGRMPQIRVTDQIKSFCAF
jgi:hypothetical protein